MLLAMPNAIYMESGGARKLVNGEMPLADGDTLGLGHVRLKVRTH